MRNVINTATLILLGMLFMPGALQAGQGWYVQLTNTNSATAAYAGIAGMNCWYPGGFENSFIIPNSPTVKQVYTEEEWAIFKDCGGDGHVIGLRFINSLNLIGYIYVILSAQPVGPGLNQIQCDGQVGVNAGFVGWKWIDGNTTTPSGVISCKAQGDQFLATITLP